MPEVGLVEALERGLRGVDVELDAEGGTETGSVGERDDTGESAGS